jgi:hypothetical protein
MAEEEIKLIGRNSTIKMNGKQQNNKTVDGTQAQWKKKIGKITEEIRPETETDHTA